LHYLLARELLALRVLLVLPVPPGLLVLPVPRALLAPLAPLARMVKMLPPPAKTATTIPVALRVK